MQERKEVQDVEEEISKDANAPCEKVGPEVPDISSWEAQQDWKPVEQSNVGLEKESHETAESGTRLEGEQCIEKDEQIEDVVSAPSDDTEDMTFEEDEGRSTPVEALKLEPSAKHSKRENLATSEVSSKIFFSPESFVVSSVMLTEQLKLYF